MLLRSLRMASCLNRVRLIRAIGFLVSFRLRPLDRASGAGMGRKSSPVVVPERRFQHRFGTYTKRRRTDQKVLVVEDSAT